jgi:endonuclease YncB( thermonuclease family)
MGKGLLLGFLLSALAAWPQIAGSQGMPATVLSIGDGDTFSVRMNGQPINVRLACIEAPETAQRPYGQQARSYLQQRLPVGSAVRLDEKPTDRYGRTVAEVFSGVSINLAMVEDGQAFAYRQYLGGCGAKEYLDAEFRASRRRYGVWQVEGGITRPWAFRRKPRLNAGQQGSNERVSCSYPSNPIAWVVQSQHLLRNSHNARSDRRSDGMGASCNQSKQRRCVVCCYSSQPNDHAHGTRAACQSQGAWQRLQV